MTMRFTRPVKFAIILGISWLLSACAAPSLTDYASEHPRFELRRYFDGKVLGAGMFSDRSGKVVRRFTVVMDCTWVGEQGTLDEAFVFDDGERQRRIWRLQKRPDGSYGGTADDVAGTAHGQEMGSAFYWRYTLRLPVDGRVYDVQMDDWMHQIDEHTVLNRTLMSKFGLHLGEVSLAFRKP